MKVHEALAKAFAAEGVTDVFGMMGNGNQHWLGSLDEVGVRQYECRHEGAALAMAEGMARITGQPGVVTTTGGPGTSQLATTMLVASRGSVPLVAFCGEANFDDDVQWLDQGRFAAACEAGFVRIKAPNKALEACQRAFYQAKTESRPVMLSVPMDVQQKTIDTFTYAPSAELLPHELISPNPVAISKAADVVERSARPVIIVGLGARAAGAGPAVRALAESIGALIATTLHSKTWLSEDDFHVGISGVYAHRTAIELFRDSDCVIAVGASLHKYTTDRGQLYPEAAFVQIDQRPSIVMGDGRAADHYIHSDGRLGTEALLAALEERGHRNSGYRTPEVKERLVTALDDPEVYEIAPGTVDPREVCRVLDAVIPPEIGLITGTGQTVGHSQMLMNRQRQVMLANQNFGCIGQGLTTAMGAIVATGGQPALLMEGDASFMMHLSEFETAVRYKLPLLAVILNDQLLGAEFYQAKAHGMNADLARIPTPDLGKVGVALGGRGALVTDIDGLKVSAAQFVAHPGPMILDVRISENVISIPYRRMHFGQDA